MSFLVTAGQSPLHGAGHHLPHLGRAEAQQTGRFRLNAGGSENGDGKALKGQGKTRVRFTPGGSNSLDAMLGTLDARQTGDQEGLKLAAIEVPPGAFLAQIVRGSRLPAFRTQQMWLLEVVGDYWKS